MIIRRITNIRLECGDDPRVELQLHNDELIVLKFKSKLRLDYLLEIAKRQVSTKSALNEADVKAILDKLRKRYSERKNPPDKRAGVITTTQSFNKIWRYDLSRSTKDRDPYFQVIIPDGSKFTDPWDLLCELYGFDSVSRTYFLAYPECPIGWPQSEQDAELGLGDGGTIVQRENLESGETLRAYLKSLGARVSAPHIFMDNCHNNWRTSGLNLQRTCQSKDMADKE